MLAALENKNNKLKFCLHCSFASQELSHCAQASRGVPGVLHTFVCHLRSCVRTDHAGLHGCCGAPARCITTFWHRWRGPRYEVGRDFLAFLLQYMPSFMYCVYALLRLYEYAHRLQLTSTVRRFCCIRNCCNYTYCVVDFGITSLCGRTVHCWRCSVSIVCFCWLLHAYTRYTAHCSIYYICYIRTHHSIVRHNTVHCFIRYTSEHTEQSP